MPLGFHNRILRVDLSTGEMQIMSPGEKFFRQYLGGTALGAALLLQNIPPHTEALSPDNPLIFTAGLLTGANGPALPRYSVLAKSPLTGAIGKSEAGGFWGPALKQAGFDALLFAGASEKPVYLFIEEGKAQLLSAENLWGKGTKACSEALREIHGKDIAVAQIGIAGENGVLFANICNELAHFNGRNGLGAVMGSKRLRAVVVRTRGKQLQLHDNEKILQISRDAAARMKEHPLAWPLHVHGTPGGVEGLNAANYFPTNNWQLGNFTGAGRIGAKAMKAIELPPKGCYSCPLRCKRVVKCEGEHEADPAFGGPELEALGSLGSCLGIDDLQLIAEANARLNDVAMDIISFGQTLAFATECFEKGLLTREQTGGMTLGFGKSDILLPLIEKTANKQGFGAVLANGSERLCALLGEAARPFLMTVKGQESPVHEPRWKSGLGLMYALAYNGSDHWIAQQDQLFHEEDSVGLKAAQPLGILSPIAIADTSWEKVRMFYYTHVYVNLLDSVGACALGYAPRSVVGITQLVELVKAATGWDTSLWELMKAGERGVTLQKLFNLREGFSRADDTLPQRLFEAAPGQPPAAWSRDTLDIAIGMYYEMSNWDERGRPRPAKLYELELGEYGQIAGVTP